MCGARRQGGLALFWTRQPEEVLIDCTNLKSVGEYKNNTSSSLKSSTHQFERCVVSFSRGPEKYACPS